MSFLTQQRLAELLHYDANSGVFTWKIDKGSAKRGDVAGARHSEGYLEISVDGNRYYAHRLAWLYVHGEWPTSTIDHRDGDRSNNRIGNLREATKKQNNENRTLQPSNSSGYRGVSWHTKGKKYMAYVNHHGSRTYLGLFNTAEEAAAAASAKRAELFTHDTGRDRIAA